MRVRKTVLGTAAALSLVLTLGACGGKDGGAKAADGEKNGDKAASASTVSVDTKNGKVEVPLKPVKVAALDNTSFATLRAFGITPVVAPKPLLPKKGYEDWAGDKKIADAGSHREPLFEAINEAQPDLIIGGYRFGEHTEKLSKIAKTIDIAPSDDSEGGYVEGLKKQTTALGVIFGQEAKAKELVTALDGASDKAAKATKGESVFLAVASAGKVDNGASRIGRLLAPLNLKNVLDGGKDSNSVHNNSGLAPETIAQLNPDWMILMDRDAATAKDGQEITPAKKVVESQEAWAKTTFKTKDQIVYLDPDFYVTEGIQAYTDAFDAVHGAFTKSA
ncbi:siderophore ABC transporter substrate-binding protein [Streptomyces sp. BI20]|uniref:siderophore ABC transporter substrate-binding protein n=1 Tax=Streptomyces sp. BI20 TaxID=3403460 RepID=UPI003C785ED3